VNLGVPEVMEIWNLVFIQFNRKVDGSLEELPDKHIDTGMGFERLTMVLQDKKFSYDTDIFSGMIQFMAGFSNIPYTGQYTSTHKSDMAMRVLADHIRAIVFTIADGTIPSNTGPGYVIRRILRRAVRYYYSYLGIKEPFMFRLVPFLVTGMGDVFPEIKSQQELIVRVIKEEESSFLRTLEGGLKRLELLQPVKGVISGQDAFELYDTYGFPIDLTKLIAKEKDWEVDEKEFSICLVQQKERSRADAKKEYSDWNLVSEGQVKFVGYDVHEVEGTRLLRWRQIQTKGQTKYQLVLETTPFYPEGGGQVGDKGILYFDNQPVEVLDTVKENDLILHMTDVLPSEPTAGVRAVINSYRRSLIQKNHSSTHLLHAALRNVLGTHVTQKGSLVNEDYLRFDFSHFQKLSASEMLRIEQLVNEKIRQNIALEETRHLPIEDARKAGAMMLFGEKYGEDVRMITFDPVYSRELCGGCHVDSTGEIGYFKLIGDSAIAAGIRRIEAVTAVKSEEFMRNQIEQLSEVRQLLNNPPNLIQQLQNLIEENKSLQKELQEQKEAKALGLKDQLVQSARRINGIQTLVTKVDLGDSKICKSLIFNLGKELDPAIIIFGFVESDKPQLMCYISEELTTSQGYNASVWLRQIAKHIQGGGGGQAFFSTAGGKNAEGMDAALAEARTILDQNLI
ncbi:MAG: alanine--tRNA ligase, partial [Saprospiraceae bacterium]|nr:alanine--tRNA ligase [Saprospiraceae bacterium]